MAAVIGAVCQKNGSVIPDSGGSIECKLSGGNSANGITTYASIGASSGINYPQVKTIARNKSLGKFNLAEIHSSNVSAGPGFVAAGRAYIFHPNKGIVTCGKSIVEENL